MSKLSKTAELLDKATTDSDARAATSVALWDVHHLQSAMAGLFKVSEGQEVLFEVDANCAQGLALIMEHCQWLALRCEEVINNSGWGTNHE